MHTWKQLNTLDALVVALCRDYVRREVAISNRAVSKRTDTEYRYLNFRIFEAAAEIVGERLAYAYICEIGGMVGYAKSEIDCMSEGTYKTYKRLIIENIAKRLHLSD